MREPAPQLARCSPMRSLLLLAPTLLAACAAAAPPDPGEGASSGPTADCIVSGSRDWQAWINAMPGPNDGPTLIVTGTVDTPTGGYQMVLDPTLRRNPADASQVVATIVGKGAGDIATQAVTAHQVRGDFPLGQQQVRSFAIRCGNTTLAEIAPLEKAY